MPNSFITHIPLSYLSTGGITVIILTIALIICDEITEYRQRLSEAEISELPNADVMSVKNGSKDKKQDIPGLMRFIEIFFLICGIVILLGTSSFISSAKALGAYGNFQKHETINSVMEAIDRGFTDESDKLPENLNGTIIIYFKYGCKDCYDIHDEISAMLSEKDKIYFVSVKSDKGEELLQTYPVAEVPSAIYILNTPTPDADYVQTLLYEPSNKNTDKSVFIENNLKQLIALQKEGT